MKRTNKRQIAKGLQEIGSAWAVRDDKYICTDHNCCQVLEGDKPAYHVHPSISDPRQNSIKRFRSLDEISGYIQARKKANAIIANVDGLATADEYHNPDDPSTAYNPYYDEIDRAMRIMEDFWASIS